MAKYLRHPIEKSSSFMPGREEPIPGNVFESPEERAIKEARFYSSISPDMAARQGLSASDSGRFMPFLEDTVLEEAKDIDPEEVPDPIRIREGPYLTQLEISGQHNPNDSSHHL